MNRLEFGRWVVATRPAAEATVRALLETSADDPRIRELTDEAFERIWAARWRVGDQPDRALRRVLVGLCRPGEFTLEASVRPSNTAEWRERATRSRSPLPSEPGRVKRRTAIAAASAVPVAAAAGALWWTSRRQPSSSTSAIQGEYFTVQLSVDPSTGVTRVARPVTTEGVGTPLASLPVVETESPHLATVVLPMGTPTRRSLRMLVVHHPELVWADLHGSGASPFTADETQTYAAAEHRLATTGSSTVVWGDLGGRVHGPDDVLPAPFPGIEDWLVYVYGVTMVVRANRRGVAQPGQNSHLLLSLPLNRDAELPLLVHELHLADGSVVLGVVWESSPRSTGPNEQVAWDLGDVPVSWPTNGGARFWHLPRPLSAFPDLSLNVDGGWRRFTIYR